MAHSLLIINRRLTITDIKKRLGDQVVFEQKREKMLVDENRKDSLITKTIDTVILDIVPYLSRPNFRGKYAVGEYGKT